MQVFWYLSLEIDENQPIISIYLSAIYIRCDTLVSDLQTIANFGFHLEFAYNSNA